MPIANSSLLHHICSPFSLIPIPSHALMYVTTLPCITIPHLSIFFHHHIFSLYTTYSPCIPISHSTSPTHSTVPLPMNLFLALSLEHMTHMHDRLDACMSFLEDTDRFGLNLEFFLKKKEWNLSLIFMANILGSESCRWAPKALTCGLK